MSRHIERLSKQVVDRIAAGEVIQRPSAALKELLENSIDAGARRVQVTVQDGGLSLLQVTDDGGGIHADDLPLLCERFATSKLRSLDDLLAMSTFGFRGEALASVSHVARVAVTTKPPDAPYALSVAYADGKMLGSPAPAAGNAGTVLRVEDMFATLLVRRRAMMAKASEEYARIVDVVARYALEYPRIGLALRRLPNASTKGGLGAGPAELAAAKVEYSFPPDSTAVANARIFFGPTVAKALLPFQAAGCADAEGGAGDGVTVAGLCSDPSLPSRKQTFVLFVNGRLVESNALRRVVDQVYAPYLVGDNRPFVFASVQVPMDRIDVNVHPTKHEVLLLDEGVVCSRLGAAIGTVLKGTLSSSAAGSIRAGPGPTLDPQALVLKPVATAVQIAPCTIARPVAQRGDLLRLLQARGGGYGATPTEPKDVVAEPKDTVKTTADTNEDHARPAACPPPRPVPTAAPFALQVDEVVVFEPDAPEEAITNHTDMAAIDSMTPAGSKRPRDDQIDHQPSPPATVRHGGLASVAAPLISLAAQLPSCHCEDDDDDSGVPMEFRRFQESARSETAKHLPPPMDSDPEQTNPSAAHLTPAPAQTAEGQAASEGPGPDTEALEPLETLQIVHDQLVAFAAASSASARAVFRGLAFVGVLNDRFVLAQSGTTLLLLEWLPLLAAVAHQRVFSRWGSQRLVVFTAETAPRVVDLLAAAATDPHDASLRARLEALHRWRDMLAEYFGVVLGWAGAGATADAAIGAHTLQDMRLFALPALLGEAWPVNQSHVPALLHGLSTAQYDGEHCLVAIGALIARTIGTGFFSPNAAADGSAAAPNPVEFRDALLGGLLPALAHPSFLPPDELLNTAVRSVVTVEALYKVFERC